LTMNETNANIIRVMVVDDHGMVRRGLAAYLKIAPDLLLVGEAENGQEALEVCKQVNPDVILMDLVMPGMGGIEATRLIRKNFPGGQVNIIRMIMTLRILNIYSISL